MMRHLVNKRVRTCIYDVERECFLPLRIPRRLLAARPLSNTSDGHRGEQPGIRDFFATQARQLRAAQDDTYRLQL